VKTQSLRRTLALAILGDLWSLARFANAHTITPPCLPQARMDAA
jgi:hypothetical protein